MPKYWIKDAKGEVMTTIKAASLADAEALFPRDVVEMVPGSDLPPPVYKTAAEAKAVMVAWIDGLTTQIEGQYPKAVQMGWFEEEEMAVAYMAGTASENQINTLTRDAAAKGRTPVEHATRILQNAQLFRGISDQTRALWLAADAQIDAATDPYQYEKILQWARDQAAPLARQFGLQA